MPSISQHSLGLGLRQPHFDFILNEWPKIDFFEIISENFMGETPIARYQLEKILSHYPIVLHGVSLGIASPVALDPDYLGQLKSLAHFTQAPFFSDHLCWTTAHGINHHDLLPLPFTYENALYIAERAAKVQDFIGLPFGLENLSSYVTFKSSEMTEWEFYNLVLEKSGCRSMLDINNIYVSSVNHGFNPKLYLDSIPWNKVLQCHMAGHARMPNGTIIDSHDEPVCDEVWDLYQYAWKISGGFPTLLEWDAKIPTFAEMHAEALKALEHRKR